MAQATPAVTLEAVPETLPLAPDAEARRGAQQFTNQMTARHFQARMVAPEASLSNAATPLARTQDGGAPGTIEFVVPVPADADPRQMRDWILRERLHYTPEDIRALEGLTPGEEFYITVQGHNERWATPDEVKRFPVEGGAARVPVRAETVRQLQEFRARRVIERAIGNIGDRALRAQVSEQLLAATTAPGAVRVGAASKLSELARAGAPEAEGVRRAVLAAADDAAGRENAALQLAAARVEVERGLAECARAQGPRDGGSQLEAGKARLQRALRLAGGLDPATGERLSGAPVDRDVAAQVNREASYLYRAAGDEAQANRHEMLSRFYSLSEAEQAGAYVGGEIPRWAQTPAGMNAMRATTPEERQLREFDRDHEAGRVPAPPSRDEALGKAQNVKRIDGSIVDGGTRQARVIAREDRGEVYTGTGQQVSPQGVERAGRVAGGVDLVNTGLTYYALYRKTQELKRHNAERAPLVAAAEASTRYPVPPRPEELGRIAAAMERARANAGDAQARARIEEALRYMPELMEASRAFWNK